MLLFTYNIFHPKSLNYSCYNCKCKCKIRSIFCSNTLMCFLPWMPYICACICVCVCVYIYMYMYAYIYIYMHICKRCVLCGLIWVIRTLICRLTLKKIKIKIRNWWKKRLTKWWMNTSPEYSHWSITGYLPLTIDVFRAQIQMWNFPPSQDHHNIVVNVNTCVVDVMWKRPIMTTNVIKNVAWLFEVSDFNQRQYISQIRI